MRKVILELESDKFGQLLKCFDIFIKTKSDSIIIRNSVINASFYGVEAVFDLEELFGARIDVDFVNPGKIINLLKLLTKKDLRFLLVDDGNRYILTNGEISLALPKVQQVYEFEGLKDKIAKYDMESRVSNIGISEDQLALIREIGKNSNYVELHLKDGNIAGVSLNTVEYSFTGTQLDKTVKYRAITPLILPPNCKYEFNIFRSGQNVQLLVFFQLESINTLYIENLEAFDDKDFIRI